jgi:hypothetical protein
MPSESFDFPSSNVPYNTELGDSAVQRTDMNSPADPAEAPVNDSVYGPPPPVVRQSNYISDEDLLVWLAQKQDGLYGDLRDRIDASRARSKLMEDLNHLKGLIDGGELDREEALAEIHELLSAYEGTEFEQTLNELFAEPLEALSRVPEEATDSMPELDTAIPLPHVETGSIQRGIVEALSKPVLDRLSSSIESKVDALGRDDQLALIEVQSLTADIREAAQLASNLVASSNQATSTIVGNIAR